MLRGVGHQARHRLSILTANSKQIPRISSKMSKSKESKKAIFELHTCNSENEYIEFFYSKALTF